MKDVKSGLAFFPGDLPLPPGPSPVPGSLPRCSELPPPEWYFRCSHRLERLMGLHVMLASAILVCKLLAMQGAQAYLVKMEEVGRSDTLSLLLPVCGGLG